MSTSDEDLIKKFKELYDECYGPGDECPNPGVPFAIEVLQKMLENRGYEIIETPHLVVRKKL